MPTTTAASPGSIHAVLKNRLGSVVPLVGVVEEVAIRRLKLSKSLKGPRAVNCWSLYHYLGKG